MREDKITPSSSAYKAELSHSKNEFSMDICIVIIRWRLGVG